MVCVLCWEQVVGEDWDEQCGEVVWDDVVVVVECCLYFCGFDQLQCGVWVCVEVQVWVGVGGLGEGDGVFFECWSDMDGVCLSDQLCD